MFTPPSKEVMDKLGKDLVGHWESVPGTKWIGGCIPLKVDYKMNVYAPTGDEDVYLNESEADATCCFCIKMHRTTTGRSSSGGLSFEEIGQDEESLHQLSSRTVDHMRDMESSGRIDMAAYTGEPNHDDNVDKYGKARKPEGLRGDGG